MQHAWQTRRTPSAASGAPACPGTHPILPPARRNAESMLCCVRGVRRCGLAGLERSHARNPDSTVSQPVQHNTIATSEKASQHETEKWYILKRALASRARAVGAGMLPQRHPPRCCSQTVPKGGQTVNHGRAHAQGPQLLKSLPLVCCVPIVVGKSLLVGLRRSIISATFQLLVGVGKALERSSPSQTSRPQIHRINTLICV